MDNDAASSTEFKSAKSLYYGAISFLVVTVFGLVCIFIGKQDSGKGTQNVGRKESAEAINVTVQPNCSIRNPTITKSHPIKTKSISPPQINHSGIVIPKNTLGRPVEWKLRDIPIFTNKFESVIADILSTQPGEGFLSLDLPPDLDTEYQLSVASHIEIGMDDPKDVVEIKKAVIAAKEEMKGYVLNGQRPSEVLSAAMLDFSKIADYRDQVQQAFNQYLVTETDPNEILAYAKEANILLDEFSALHIEAPDTVEAAYDLMIAAKEEKTAELSDKLKTEDEDPLK